jgi:PAS domain S-box-containing protein
MKKESKIVESAASFAKLRKKAEGIAREKKVKLPENMEAMSPKAIRQTLHELRVHQIELDMQNEALRQTQAELAAERARYFDLYDMAPVGYLTLNEKGLIQNANLTAAKLLGMTKKSLLRQLLARFILQDDQDIYYRHRKSLWETDAPQSWEMRLVKKGGTAFCAHLEATNARQDHSTGSLRPGSAHAGQAGGSELRIAFSDITPSKWAADELQKSEGRYQNIFDNANEAIFVVQDGKVVFSNPMTTTISGYSAEEYAHSTFIEFIHPDDQEMIADRYARRMMGEELSHIYSFRIIHKGGSIRWVELNAVLIEWKGSAATLNFLSDITDRKRAEQVILKASDELEQQVVEQTTQLRQEIEQRKAASLYSRSLIEASIDSLVTISTTGKITDVNTATEKITGLSRSELIGSDFSNYFTEPEMARAAYKETFSRGEITDYPLNICHTSGKITDVIYNASVYRNEQGSIIGIFAAARDITARKLMESKIIAMNSQMEIAMTKAKEATLVKSRFLANMSHEIRTPLSALIGMTGLLLATPLTDKQRSYTEKINTSGESLLAILNDILDFSKIEAGKIIFESAPFSVEKVMDQVVNIFEQRAREKGIFLSSTIDPKLPATVLGDPHRLTQVISNLVANAVKFTAAGKIELAVSVRKQSAADVELEISVRDTGIGMTKEELPRLFQSFSQADSSTTRRYGGSGLGLAISKQLVELRQGTIRVESTPGKGSIFTVVLSYPIVTETLVADLTMNPVLLRKQFSGVRALVAEDLDINMEIIVELLRQAGIAADTAKNGREAVEKVRAQDYDILFMDIEMPEMDGLAATREIRNLGRKSVESLPIIAMTAHVLTGDREKSLVAGMSDHLTKPISPDALDKALRQWLPRGKYAVHKPDFVIEPDMTNSSSAQSLDVEEGLNRLGGNSKLYLKLLRDFIAGYGETPEQLLQELRMEQGKEALHRVHAIRGIAGNLGGKELAAAAAELEKALQEAENGVPFSLGKPLRLFTDRHEALITSIGSVLVRHPDVKPAKADGPPGEIAQLQLEMERLKVFLKNKEPLPCQEILETLLQSRWPDGHEVALLEINRLVSNYRMIDALALLEKEYSNP